MAVVAGGAVVVVADGCSVVAEDEDEDDDGAESNSAAPLCCCASSMLSSVLNALEMFGVSASKARAADTAASAPPFSLLLTPAPTTISTKKQANSEQQALFVLFWQVQKNVYTKAKFHHFCGLCFKPKTARSASLSQHTHTHTLSLSLDLSFC